MLKRPGMRSMSRERGFTLVEVLVAVVVLSIGLLGLAGLQLSSLQANQQAFLRSQATVLGQDIIERMRANRQAALAGEYDIAFGASAPTGADIAANDVNEWLTALGASLPDGEGEIDVDADGVAEVSVRWTERARDPEAAAATETMTFTTETQL